MTTRNLVPRLSGEGKLGISSKPWAEVNATAAAFTTLNISNLKNASGQDLLVAGTGVSLSSSGSQISIGLTTAFLDDLGFDTTSGLNTGFTRNNGDALTTDDSLESGDSIKVALQKLNDDLRGVAVPTIVFNNLAGALVINASEGIASNNSDTALPTASAVKSYVDAQNTAQTLNIQGDSGTSRSIILGSEVLDIAGGDGISTNTDTDNQVTVSLDNTSVTAGDYGGATAIPVLAIDAQGRITSASTASVASKLKVNGDNNVTDDIEIELLSDVLDFTGSGGITTAAGENQITITLGNTLVTPDTYGSATAIPTFTVDAQGRLTAAGSEAISTKFTLSADSGTDDEFLVGGTLTFAGTQDVVSTTVSNDTITIDLVDTDVTAGSYGDADSVAQFTVDAQGRLTQAANVDISITSAQVSDATSANTVSTIVERDGSGNFSAGTITATLSGNASSASKWVDARTLSLGGDLDGSVSIDGTTNVTLSATIAENSVALGTDTTGNYVQSLTAGTGITTLPTASETADLTISVDGVLAQLDALDPLADGDDDGKFIVATAANTFAYESGATVRSSLGLGDLSPLTDENDAIIALSMANNLLIDNAKELRFGELDSSSGEEYIAIKAPNSIGTSYTLTLPSSQGGAGTVLVTDAAGNLTWETVEAAAGNVVNAFSKIIVSTSGQADLEADASQDTLNITEGTGISLATNADTDTLTISVDSSDLSTLAALTSVGASGDTLAAQGHLSVAQNLTVTGNLVVNGSSTTIDTQTLTVEDSLIKLAINNSDSDIIDIGFYGLYDSTESQDVFAGLFRDASDGKFKLFKDLQAEPTTTVDTSATGYSSATLVADLEGDVTGEVSSLSNHTTTNLTEGDNKYFTNERARSAVSASDAGGDGSFVYDSETGQFTYTGPSAAETRAHFTQGTGVTISGGQISIGQSVATTDSVTFSSVNADLEGDVTGNADTATTLLTSRTIQISGDSAGSASFNGSTDINIATTIQADAVENDMILNPGYNYSAGGTPELVELGQTITIQGTTNEVEVARASGTGTFTVGLPSTISGLTSISSTGFTGALSGNASTASKWVDARTLSLGGDVLSGSVSIDGSTNVTLTATVGNGSIDNAMLATISAENKVSAISLDVENASNYATSGSDVLNASDKILVHDVSAASTKNKAATLSQLITFLEDESTFNGSTNIDTLGTITTGTWNGSVIADDFVANDLTINGGSINETTIGLTSHMAGKFTTLIADSSLVINESTAITSVDTDLSSVSSTDNSIASAKAIKTYVDAQNTAQALSVQADSGDSRSIILGSEVLDIAGGDGIDTNTDTDNQVTVSIDSTVATLTGTQTLTNKTLTTPKINDTSSDHTYDVKVSELTADREITLPLLTGNDTFVFEAHPQTLTNKTIDFNGTGNNITNVEVHNFADAAIILKEQDSNGEGIASNDSDTALPTASAVKQYVDDQLGRFGGIFKTHEVTAATFNESNELTSAGVYDVQFDSSPLVRSHFGPFAFDLGQLVSSGGSDITFFGATATGASDRHFLVVGSDAGTDTKGDCKFTGADHTTP